MFELINEDQVQMQIVVYLRSLGYLVFSVPNETAGKIRGGGGLARMARLKAMGLLPGASDLVVVGDHPKIWYVEIKFGKGKQRPSQKEFEKELKRRGWEYIVFYSLKECRNFYKNIDKTL